MADAELAIRVTGDVAEANDALDSVRDNAESIGDVGGDDDGGLFGDAIDAASESIGINADQLESWIEIAQTVINFLDELRDAIIETAEEFNELADAAARSGANVEEFAALRDAFQAVGAGDPSNTLAQIARSLRQAQDASSDAAIAYAQLGLSVEELEAADASERVLLIAEALSAVNDETERATLGTQVLGAAYGDMAVAIENSHGNLDDLIEGQSQYGALTEQTARVSQDLREANVELARAFQELRGVLVIAFGPTLTVLTRQLAEVLQLLIDMIALSRDLGLFAPLDFLGRGIEGVIPDEEFDNADERLSELRNDTLDLRRELAALDNQATQADAAGGAISGTRGGFSALLNIERANRNEAQRRDLLKQIEENTREMAERQQDASRESGNGRGGWERVDGAVYFRSPLSPIAQYVLNRLF